MLPGPESSSFKEKETQLIKALHDQLGFRAVIVRIEALRNDKGTVYVSLFDDKKAFSDNKNAVVSGQTRPANRSAVVVLDNVAPGRSALSFVPPQFDDAG